jgi:hypothetical protein
MAFESFRTRNPSSTYIGGVPLSIPIGEAALTRLEAVQIAPAQGSFTTSSPGVYDFTVATIVNLTAEVSLLGTVFALPPLPGPVTLAGQVSVSGSTAQLLSVQPFVFSNTTQPGLAIPEFPLDLPTVLPPGLTASVLFNLTLNSIATNLNTEMTTTATGTLVPAPGTLALAGMMLIARRRRR